MAAEPVAKGIPAVVVLILVVELCERFCYYTIQGSQKSFMNQRLGYDNAQSTTISLVWGTLCYLTCLGGGVLGDRFLGRFMTIAILSAWYVVGCGLLSLSTLPSMNSKGLFLFAAFGGIAVGTGGIKPLVCNFGADQIADPQSKEAFFSYFYWMIQIGAGVALGFMTTIATNPEQFGFGQEYGFFVSYIIASGGMLLALVFFLSGSCGFQNKFLTTSSQIFRPVFRALTTAASKTGRGKVAVLGWVLTVPFFALVFVQAFATNPTVQSILAWISCLLAFVQFACLCWAHSDNKFLHLAARDLGAGGSADALSPAEVSMTFQTIPLLLISNTVFNFAYSMMLGPFYNQSCQMDLRVGGSQLNGAIFNLADTLVIILFIPLFEACLFPLWARMQSRPVSTNQKLLLGFAFALLAMLSAAVLEIARRRAAVIAPPGWSPSADPSVAFPGFNFHGDDGDYAYSTFSSLMGACKVPGDDADWCSNCAAKMPFPANDPKSSLQAGIYMSSISGWWMFVPYALIGLGEICVNPVLYYYAYSMTPQKTQSVVQAVNLIFQGAYPPALTGVFITAFATAMPNNLNLGQIQGHDIGLEIFYYIGALFVLVGLPVLILAKRACVVVSPTEALENEQENGSLIRTASEVLSRQGSFTPNVTEGIPSSSAARQNGPSVQLI